MLCYVMFCYVMLFMLFIRYCYSILLYCIFFYLLLQEPLNRRGHSAVIYRDSMFLFGGILDTGHASNELWRYSFSKHELAFQEFFLL